MTQRASAHFLDITSEWMVFDSATIDLIASRAAVDDQPLLRSGDEITVILKAFPDAGTTFGAGGYLTFYIPEGTQVLDTAYVYPDGSGNYVEIPVKQPSPTDDDAGDRGADSIPELIGLTSGPNALGRTELMVDAAGNTRGTLAGVMGDTGVFYSTDPRTSFFSWQNSQYCADPAGDCRVSSQTNGLTTPHNTWDAFQILGYGNADSNGADVQNLPANALGGIAYIDPSGHGSTAWGLANAVAGPESGYMNEFDLDIFDGTGSASNVKASVSNIGPWNRIQYPGSTISDDRRPENAGNSLATAWVGAADLGRDIDADPLPPTLSWSDDTSPKAIRFSVGGTQRNRFEYAQVTLRLLEDPGSSNPNPYDSNGCFEINGEAFGGDAGWTDDNKDHIYRYILPDLQTLNPCTQLIKYASVASATAGDTFDYYVQFINMGTVTIPSFTITEPVPSGLTVQNETAVHIDASLQTTTVLPGGGGNPLVWTLPDMESGDVFSATVSVLATSNGPFENTVSASDPTIADATEQVAEGAGVVVVPNKTVDPSTATPGSTVQYTISIDNLGAGATVPGQPIVVADGLPDGFTYVSGTATATLNGVSTAVAVDDTDPSNPIFTVVGQIDGGNSLVIVMDAVIDPLTDVGTYRNDVFVTFQDPIAGENQVDGYGLAPVKVSASSIGDYVFYDWNGDGVQDPEEEGIGGIVVELTDSLGNVITTTTDADGLYLFPGLEGGTYTVTVAADNFLPGAPLDGFPQTFEGDGTPDNSYVTTLGDETEERDADFGFWPRGDGSIGDYIFHDTNEDGLPAGEPGLDGVTVYLYEDTDGDGEITPGVDQLVATTVTEDGLYSFDNLAEGFDYLVTVDPLDPAIQAGMPDNSYVLSTDNPQVVTNLTGDYTLADIGFRDVPPSSIGDQLCIDGDMDGLCTPGDPDDTPIGDVTVTLYVDTNGNGVIDAGDAVYGTTVSDPITGEYIFDELPPGDYIVDVDDQDPDVPAGYAPSDDEIVVNLPVPPPGATTGTDIDTADFPFVPLIVKAVNTETASPGDTITYTINVQYPQGDLLENVEVTDDIPAGLTYVPGSANAGGTESGGTVTWSLGSNDPAIPGIYDGFDRFSVAFDSDKDTYLNQQQTARNYGIATTLVVDPRSGEAARPLIEWDLSSIPSNAIVDFAYIELFQSAFEGNAETLKVDVHAVTAAWQEGTQNDATGTASWTNRLPATPWSTAGGDYVGTPAGTLNVTPSGDNTEFEWIITDLVQDWVDGSLTNNGVLFKAASESGGDGERHIFNSAESAFAPELIIIYRVPNGPPRNTFMSAQPTLIGDNGEIQITLELTASQTITDVTPSALTVLGTNGASADNCSAPSPAGPFDIAGGTSIFVTYTCDAVAGTNVGEVRFRANATTALGYTFNNATSNSVIVAPPLTFQATVDLPPTETIFVNEGVIFDADNIEPTNSNPVTTTLVAAIGDFIWYDQDGDGQQDPGEPGIPGVEVTLTLPDNSTITVFTDETGFYLFPGLDAGTYDVDVNLATIPVDVVQTFDPDGTFDSSTTYTLADQEYYGGADFGYQPVLIDKQVSSATASPGDTLAYTVTVIYPFPTLLSTVTISDVIPAGTTYVPGSANVGGTEAGGVVTWDLGSNTADEPGFILPSYQCGGGVEVGGCTQTVTLVASADTYIEEDDQAANNATANPVLTRDETGAINRALYRFNLNAIPADAIIDSATLRITSNNTRAGHTVEVYRVTTAWGETANWTTPWTSPGGDFDAGTSYGTLAANQTTQALDVTALVDLWINGGATNNGVILDPTEVANGDAQWVTRTDGTAAERPQLEITFRSPVVNTTLAATQDTYIEEDDQAANNGAAQPILTRPEATAINRALYQFDTSGLPSGATVTSAELNISSANSRSNHFADVKQVTTAWTNTANWTTPWTSDGGDFGATVYGTLTPVGNDTYQTANVTALVQLWVDGTANNGIVLDPTGTDAGDAQWNTLDEAGFEPFIRVTYTAEQISGSKGTELTAGYSLVTSGETFQVTMGLTTTESVASATPTTLTVNGTNGASAVCVGPVPSSDGVEPGTTTTFVWTCTATAGSDVGTLTFEAGADGGVGNTFATATSNSVIVTPPLTFEVTVDEPPTEAFLVNEAIIADAGVIPPNVSDPVTTTLKSSIGDRLWNDFDGDGEQDPEETGIEGVTVNLTDAFGNVFTTTTGTDGLYYFGDLDPGTYTVTVNTTTLPIDAEQTFDPDGLRDSTHALTIGASEIVDTVDFGYQPILITKAVNATEANPGDTLTYTLTVNYPLDAALSNVTVSDTVPDGTTYVPDSDTPEATVAPADDLTATNLLWDLGSNAPAVPGDVALCPATLPLTTIKDTSLNSSNATRSYGALATLALDSNDVRHGILEFNVGTSTLPAGSQLLRAELQLTVQGGQNANRTVAVRLPDGAIRDWTEAGTDATCTTGASWNAPNCTDTGLGWNGSGGNFGTVAGTQPIIGTIFPAVDETAYAVDVTSEVDAWLSGGANNGFVLFANGSDTGTVSFHAKESAETAKRPQLILYYLVPTAGGCDDVTTAAVAADTSIDEGNSTRNYGTTTVLTTEPDAGQQTHALIEFDLVSIPPGAIINSATLNVTVASARNTDHVVTVHRATSGWAEGSQDNVDCTAGASWGAPNCTDTWAGGGAFSASDYDATSLGSFTPDTTGVRSVDITSLVDDWVNSGTANNGVVLLTGGTDTGAATYASSENATVANRPTLVIDWTLPAQAFTSLNASPALIDSGQTFNVTMILTSSVDTYTGVTPSALTITDLNGNGVGATCAGPTPTSDSVVPGTPTEFTWSCTPTGATEIGNLQISASAIDDEGFPFAEADSDSVIVVPPLTFQVTADSPPSVGTVENTGFLDSEQFAPVSSNTVETVLGELGSIGDRVWLDEDGDGLQDAGEDGISNVTVELLDSGGNVIATTTTGADGDYIFTDLVEGDYTVRIDTTTLDSGLAANPTFDEDGIVTAHESDVTLAAGEIHTTADFGYNWVAPADSDTPASGATGAIGDYIWNDADGDGVQDPEEIGLAGITVTLYTDPDGDGIYDTVYATTTTDDSGHYIFDDLPPGSYVVEVDPTNLPAGWNPTPTADPDGDGDNTTEPIVVAPGDVFLNADFGYTADPGVGSTIGDQIFVDLDGDGLPDAGEPGIPGVTVNLLDADGDVIATTTTDENGNYTFPDLPAGTYTVQVSDTNNVLADYELYNDPDGGTPDGQSTITVDGVNDNLLQDFAYVPDGHDPGAAGKNGLIGDTIYLDTDDSGGFTAGEGLEGVTVTLTDEFGNVVTTTTDANGNYYFGALDPTATYTVTVDTTTLPSAGAGLVNFDDPDGGTASQSVVDLSAVGGIDLDQDFGYNASTPNTIEGTVWNDTNADGTLNEGAPNGIEGVTVVLRDADGAIVATTTTDADGNYSFTNLPDGSYTVDVTDDDNVLAGYWHSDGPNDGADNNSQVDPYLVTVSGGATDSTADFGYYVELASIGNFVWEDADRDGIQDAGEPGLPGVPVTLTITYPNGDVVTVTTVTDENGFYSFDNLLADEDYDGADAGEPTFIITAGTPPLYSPTTIGAGGDPALDSDDPAGTTATPVQGATDDTYDFGFIPPEPGAIGNRVWLDEDGDGIQDAGEDGIADVIVELYDADGTLVATTTTDTDGSYIFPDLPPGDYTVVVDRTSLPIGLRVNQTGDPDGTFDNETTITLDPGEEELDADFGYNWVPSGDSTAPTAGDTGAIGDYIWSDVDGDGVQDPGEIGLEGITVRLYTDDNGDGVYGGPGDSAPLVTTTDAAGGYIFDGLEPGSYVVEVDPTNLPAGWNPTPTGDPDGDGDNVSDPIVLAPGDVFVNADWGYQPVGTGSTIGDQIFIDANQDGDYDPGIDTPLPGVTVSLLDDEGNVIGTTTTDENGLYEFPNLPAGTYTVVVTDTDNVLSGLTPTSDADGGNDEQSTVTVDGTNPNLDQDFGYAPLGHDPGDGYIGDTIFIDTNDDGFLSAGEGIEGVTVELTDENGNTFTTVTDENGNYYFGNLDPTGTYTVTVDPLNQTVNAPGSGLTNTIDPDGGIASQSVIDLSADPDGTNDGINIDQDFGYADPVGDATGAVTGTIWNDADADGTLDGDEPGRYEGVTVVLLDDQGNIVATTTTDEFGDYTFDNVPPGDYTVDVTDEDNVLAGTWHSDGVDGVDGESQPDPAPVTVVAGATADADFGYYVEPGGLGNFVWNDLNGNGVQDSGEPGIEGVIVNLTITYPTGDVVTLTTTTDADGFYSFDNLLADESFDGVGGGEPTYVISVETPDTATPTTQNETAETLDSDDPTGEPATVTQGEVNETYDFGFVFPEPGTIGDRLWLDEDGDGVQDAGEDGIGNVTVTLTDAKGNVFTTTTGADGSYIFTDLAPNETYTVTIDPNGDTLPSGLVPTYDEDDGTTNPDGVTVVTLQDGEEHDTADFGYNWVPPTDSTTPGAGATGAIGDYIWNDANGDGVQDAGEIGLAGITVTLYTDPDGDGIYDTVAAVTTTDETGHYIFDGLAPDAYVVEVDPTNLPAGWSPTPTGDPDGDGDNVSDPIILAPGDVFVNADWGYQPIGTGSTIGDQIFIDANRDGDYDPGIDTPLEGVTVNLLDDQGNVIATTTTDENGLYAFPNLPGGTYTVEVTDTDNVLGDLTPTYDADGGNDEQSTVTVDGINPNLDQDFGYAPLGHDPGEGYIGDTVFIDTDSSGDLTAGEGVEGVTVQLTDENGNTVTTITDENGNYYFGGLDPTGTYTVTVDPTAATVNDAGAGLTNTIDPDGGLDSQSVIDLSADPDGTNDGINVDQDFGYDDPAGTATGIVTGTIWNDTDANGTLDGDEPGRYEGVTVVLLDDQGNIVATTTTDVNGDYTFENVSPGDYTVDVTDEDGVLTGTWHSDGVDGVDGESQPDPAPVTVTAGGTANADFGYYVDPGALGNFVWNDLDADGIQDAGEPGIEGVLVTLVIDYPSGDTVTVTTTTDVNGFYSFDGLLADESFDGADAGEPTYTISVATPDGFEPAAQDQTTEDLDSDNPNGEAATVTQGAINETYDFGFVSLEAAAIGNTVWIDEDADGIQDAGETGLANVVVELYDSTGTTLLFTTTTDLNGNYVFAEVKAGTYQVKVDETTLPAGLQVSNLGPNPGDDYNNQAQNYTVTVTPGEENMTADFGYTWADPDDITNGTGTGAIGDNVFIDADGNGIQDPGEPGLGGITVTLYTDPDGDGIYDTVAGTTTTNPDGSYIFTALPPDGYVVEVTTPLSYTLTADPDATLDGSTFVLLGPGDAYLDADFGFQPDPAIASTIGDTVYFDYEANGVLDGPDAGIPGVTVALLDADGNIIATTVTDENGNYFFTGVPDGEYTVWVNDTDNVLGALVPTADADGTGTPNTSTTTIAGADDLDQDFGYAPFLHDNTDNLIGDTIFLDINGTGGQDAGEPGLEGVTVELYDNTNTLVGTTVTDENGTYYFGNLPDGTYTVRVVTTTLPDGGVDLVNTFDPDLSTLNESTVLVTGGTIDLLQDFGYQPANPGAISGTVWNDADANGTLDEGAGSGLEGVTVVLRDPDGNIVAKTTTDANGDYSFEGLPPGEYVVDVTDEANILDGYWHSDGPNDGADNNSQTDPYPVTLAPGETNTTADFGYYTDPGAVGNLVWWDRNGDGLRTADEPGLGGVPVQLVVTYPDDTTVTVTVLTNPDGTYDIPVLQDENYDGVTATPTYTVTMTTPPGTTSTHDGVDDAAGVGAGTDDNADDPAGEGAYPAQGVSDTTNDFGFASEADLGDLPDTGPGIGVGNYATLLAEGPAHLLYPDLGDNVPDDIDGAEPAFWLGFTVDDELDGQPDTNATGDGVDEDGLFFVGTGVIAPGFFITPQIVMNSNQPVEVNWGLWMDWNADGDFFDAQEFFTGSASVNGPTAVTQEVEIPTVYTEDQPVYFRVRLFNADKKVTVDDYTGTVVNGEVEDYVQAFDPTAVQLQQITGTMETGRNWQVVGAIGVLTLLTTGMWLRRYRRVARRRS